MTDTTRLDAAILALRDCPCDAHEEEAWAAAHEQNERFLLQLAEEYKQRTKK